MYVFRCQTPSKQMFHGNNISLNRKFTISSLCYVLSISLPSGIDVDVDEDLFYASFNQVIHMLLMHGFCT